MAISDHLAVPLKHYLFEAYVLSPPPLNLLPSSASLRSSVRPCFLALLLHVDPSLPPPILQLEVVCLILPPLVFVLLTRLLCCA